jgi:hypothetical protein
MPEYDVLRDEGDGFSGQGAVVAGADLAFTEIAHAVRDLLTS